MSRALIYVLIIAAWAIFTGAVIYYQDRDSGTAGEHEDSQDGEPEFSAAA